MCYAECVCDATALTRFIIGRSEILLIYSEFGTKPDIIAVSVEDTKNAHQVELKTYIFRAFEVLLQG